jgi:gluconolactonase
MLARREALLGGLALTLTGCVGSAMMRGDTMPAPLTPDDFSPVLSGIDHAEGAATSPDGRLFLSNGGGTIGVLETDGRLRQIGKPLMPTGVAMDTKGRVIVANMGLLNGGPGSLQRVDLVTGMVETLVDTLEGRALVASNGPAAARDGTLYCTHSTWGPVANIGTSTAAGFIYRVAPDGTASIVARDLRGPNGLTLSPDERHLYCALTAEGRVRRWRRRPDGTLGEPQDFGPPLGKVTADQGFKAILALPSQERAALGYCDGIAFDRVGNLWITLPFANRIVALTPDGQKVDVVHDPEGKMVAMPTNLCWGGPDLRTLYVVSRSKGMIVSARTNVAGAPLANWPAT